MENSNVNKMESKSVFKLLISMAVPLIISMLVQALYNIFDSMFVSYMNDNKVAFNAVSLANSMQLLMIAVSTGIGVGMNALLSKSLGEKNSKKANYAARNAMILATLAWLVFFVLGFTIPYYFLKSQTNDVSVINEGIKYLRIVMCGSFFLFLQVTFERMLQATGRAVLSMTIQLTGAIINIILDPIFIFTFKLGIAGAAYATIIGQFIASICGLILNIIKNKEISFNLKKDKKIFDGKSLISILKVGIPSTIMVAIGSVLTFGLMAILNTLSASNGIETIKNAQNAYGAYVKLQSFVFMPVFGLNNALVPIVAYNYGAKKKDNMFKAFKYSLIIAVSMMVIGTLIFELLPEQLLKIFNSEGEMITYGNQVLRIIAISFILAACGIVISSWFQALGNGLYSMIVSLVRQIIVLLPVAYLLSLSNNISLIWWAFPIAEVVGFTLSLCLLFHTNKKLKKLTVL